jgi:hypothetical protein
MSQSLIEVLDCFADPQNEAQLRQLEEILGSLRPKSCGSKEFRALLGVFERFPADDGYGVFWSIVHLLEASTNYEPALLESVARMPVEFNVLMVNRLLNGGIAEVEGRSLLAVLSSVASNPAVGDRVRESAQRFIARQMEHGRL